MFVYNDGHRRTDHGIASGSRGVPLLFLFLRGGGGGGLKAAFSSSLPRPPFSSCRWPVDIYDSTEVQEQWLMSDGRVTGS
jgi:hypothetical protein